MNSQPPVASEETRQKWRKGKDDKGNKIEIPIGKETVRTAWCPFEGHRASSDFQGVVADGWLFHCAGKRYRGKLLDGTQHYFVAEPPK